MNALSTLALSFAGIQHPVADVKPLCGLAKAIAPATNNVAGQILGLSSLASPLIVILLVILIFVAATRLRGPLMVAVLTILGVGVALSVASPILKVIMPSSC